MQDITVKYSGAHALSNHKDFSIKSILSIQDGDKSLGTVKFNESVTVKYDKAKHNYELHLKLPLKAHKKVMASTKKERDGDITRVINEYKYLECETIHNIIVYFDTEKNIILRGDKVISETSKDYITSIKTRQITKK